MDLNVFPDVKQLFNILYIERHVNSGRVLKISWLGTHSLKRFLSSKQVSDLYKCDGFESSSKLL